jgi:hypothetical protein
MITSGDSLSLLAAESLDVDGRKGATWLQRKAQVERELRKEE